VACHTSLQERCQEIPRPQECFLGSEQWYDELKVVQLRVVTAGEHLRRELVNLGALLERRSQEVPYVSSSSSLPTSHQSLVPLERSNTSCIPYPLG
jgi:hypothetical protein